MAKQNVTAIHVVEIIQSDHGGGGLTHITSTNIECPAFPDRQVDKHSQPNY